MRFAAFFFGAEKRFLIHQPSLPVLPVTLIGTEVFVGVRVIYLRANNAVLEAQNGPHREKCQQVFLRLEYNVCPNLKVQLTLVNYKIVCCTQCVHIGYYYFVISVTYLLTYLLTYLDYRGRKRYVHGA